MAFDGFYPAAPYSDPAFSRFTLPSIAGGPLTPATIVNCSVAVVVAVGLPATITAASPPAPVDDYQEWLSLDSQNRIVLSEIGVYSSGVLQTRYISDVSFTSGPLDTPPNQTYDEVLAVIPRFSTKMSEQLSGQSSPSWGDVEIRNDNGAFDSWLDDAWDGRAIDNYFGDASWRRNEFRKIMSGTIADIQAKDSNTLTLKIRDKQWYLNVPVQTNLIGGTTANTDQPVPLCFGDCFNIEPVLLDGTISKYQVHDGSVQAITAVFDNGVSVAFTATLAAGTFVLTAAPVGRITANVQGSNAGVYRTTCAEIFQHLIETCTLLSDADIDTDNFYQFRMRCPQALNLYVRERENLMAVLDQLIMSVGGWYGFSREGLMQLGRLEAPGGESALDLIADDIAEGQLRQIRRQIPLTRVLLGYRKNWTMQKDGLAGAVTQERRTELANEYRIAKAEDLTVQTAHPLAISPALEGTLLTLESDAVDEAWRRLSLRSVVRSIYAAEGFSAPFSVSLGSHVKLTHPRFGFDAGASAIVVGIDEQPTLNRLSLEIWK